ncbi:MAG: translation initiation factor eIF-1A [Methermicoccaceae archaeon]
MVYKKGSQRKKEKQNSGSDEVIQRVRIPQPEKGEMFGMVEAMLGSNHVKVKCMDGTVRLGRIEGKMKKRVWIREGDIVIVIPWEFQDSKANIVWRYTQPQVEWLQRRGYLK